LDLSILSLTDAGSIRAAVGLGAGGNFIAGNPCRGATARIDRPGVLSGEKVREGRKAPQWSFSRGRIRTATGGGINPIIGWSDAIAV
jgi:hypothetical protein